MYSAPFPDSNAIVLTTSLLRSSHSSLHHDFATQYLDIILPTAMDATAPSIPPTFSELPQQARTFLPAHLANQAAEIAYLENECVFLRHELDRLKAQHPSIDAKTDIMDMRSFGRTANAGIAEELDRIGADFDIQIGERSDDGGINER